MNLNQAFPPPPMVWTDLQTGQLTPGAYEFLLALFVRTGGNTGIMVPDPIIGLSVAASPFSYKATGPSSLLIIGGSVTKITLLRLKVLTTLFSTTVKTTNVSTGFIPLSLNDQVTLTFGVAPAVSVIPGT